MKKKTKDVREEPVNYNELSDVRMHDDYDDGFILGDKTRMDFYRDVHAYKVNPNEPTAEDLDVSWPSFRDRRFQ